MEVVDNIYRESVGDDLRANTSMAQELSEITSPSIEIATAIIQKFAEITSPLTEVIVKFQEQIDNIIAPLRQVLSSFTFSFPSEFITTLKEKFRPFGAIVALSQSQYVFWEYLTNDFVNALTDSQNINKTLREYHEKDKYKSVRITIKNCSERLPPNISRLFIQAIFAYDNKRYDLCAVGLISLIDGLLTIVSGDTGTSIFKRADLILNKIYDDDVIDSEEFSILALTWTFRETMESLCAKSDFNSKEPSCLNRHWIAHGRSNRKRTKLDCIKLINFIYGTILINGFSEDTLNKRKISF